MATTTSNCEACKNQNDSSYLSKQEIGKFASSGNFGGAMGASLGMVMDKKTANKLGGLMSKNSTSNLLKLIDTPGTNKQKENMSSNQKMTHLISSVGLGNFSLNSDYEDGIINSVLNARGQSSSFLRNSDTGSSLIAATSLGIDIPNADMLGIGSNESFMFKILKLAAFGLKLLCATLADKKRGTGPNDYSSDTEELLGLLLLLGLGGILGLLARLLSIFDKLLGLSKNFSSFGIQDLNIGNMLVDLCDWVNNMEFGSNTIDMFRDSFDKTLSNKSLTNLVGNKLISDGTYDTYARNDFNFDQQFKSIAGDIDMLKCDACKVGTADLTIMGGDKQLFNLEFDPRTGFKRETGFEDIDLTNNLTKNIPTEITKTIDIKESTGGIDYLPKDDLFGNTDTETESNNTSTDISDITNLDKTKTQKTNVNTQLGELLKNENKNNETITTKNSDSKTVNQYMGIPDDETNETNTSDNNKNNSNESELDKDKKKSDEITTPGVKYETSNSNIKYNTYVDENGNIKEQKYEKKSDNKVNLVEDKVLYTKPYGGEPAKEGDDKVTSFHTGETITKNELKGTVLENADLNAVALLHPNDLSNLKDTDKVNQTLEEAERIYDNALGEEIEKTENLVLKKQTSGIIFGKQLPPKLNGNQIVINSERILMSAKTQEFGIFSKRKFFVSTDDEITMNCKERFVVRTDKHASIEAPTVHLGVYTTRNHPSLKGDCTVWWLQELCDWLSRHTHSDPWVTTGTPVQQGWLASLRSRAPNLLSERIFISG